MTVTAHAHVLFSSTGVYILLISLITFRPVHKFEILGYMIFAIGIFITITDPVARKAEGGTHPIMGDLIAFIGAGFGAVVGLLSHTNCQIFHPLALLMQMFFFITLLQLAIFPFLQDNPLYYSFDIAEGAFGWMVNLKAFIYLETVVVPVTSILGNIGFLKCFQYWPTEIVSVILLFEPIVCEIMAVLLGQDDIPGIHTLLGILIIGFGLFLASYGAKEKVNEEFNSKNVQFNTSSVDFKLIDENEMKSL